MFLSECFVPNGLNDQKKCQELFTHTDADLKVERQMHECRRCTIYHHLL